MATLVHRELRRLCSRDGGLFLKSALLLAVTRVGLSTFSLQRCRHMLTRVSATAHGQPRSPAPNGVDRVRWAILRASLFVPGAQHCLTQALAAQVLLARCGRPTELRIGVAKDEKGRLKAHAWLESEGAAIFGAPESGLHEYRVLPHLDRA